MGSDGWVRALCFFMNNTAIPLYIPHVLIPDGLADSYLYNFYHAYIQPMIFLCTIALQCGISFAVHHESAICIHILPPLFNLYLLLEIILVCFILKFLQKEDFYRIVLNEKPTCSAT